VRTNSGESEAKLRSLFADAAASAPAILFIDEIDAIAPKRESAQREMERRIVAQMLTCMDDLLPAAAAPTSADDTATTADDASAPASSSAHVVVIGATNRPDALDPALRRAGRFDREISLGIPTEAARREILKVLCRGLRLEGDVDSAELARSTPGYVGADLAALTKEAAALAVARIFAELDAARVNEGPMVAGAAGAGGVASSNGDSAFAGNSSVAAGTRGARRTALSREQLERLAITMGDFEGALVKVQPSVRREGFSTKPDVTWADVVRVHLF
jgi:ribosome biogenesis ATPase